MSLIQTTNDGARIVRSTYWGSEYDDAGKMFASVNAGTVRLLLPRRPARAFAELVTAVRECREAILSRGPWPDAGLDDAIEILLADGSDDPYAIHLSRESFDVLPAEPPAGSEWRLAVWDNRLGRPTRIAERRLRYRRVDKIPCLRAWDD